MSTNLNYKQVANVERRTWDTEAYEKRAKERLKEADGSNNDKKKKRKHGGSNDGDNNDHGNDGTTLGVFGGDKDEGTKEEFIPAAPGAAGPHKSQRAFLKARSQKVDVDSKIGSVEIVNPEAASTTKAKVQDSGALKDTAITKTGIGWHCKVCDCFLRDSHTYLDHINGRKHQKNLGYSMRVERSTKDQVSSRLEALAKEKEAATASKTLLDPNDEGEDFFDVVKAKDEEAKRRKEERARKRKERKKEKKEAAKQEVVVEQKSTEGEEKEEGDGEEESEGGLDPALAAMMGFSGFGGGNKNR